jgi:polysaccharide export outer membrane protein
MKRAFLLLLLTGCFDRAVAPYPKSEPPSPKDIAIAAGDVFEVKVFNEASLSSVYQVTDDGTISFPYLGHIAVAGMTPSQIEHTLEDKLRDGYIKDPTVSVHVTDLASKKIVVVGQVKSPGTFQFAEGMSIVEAISRAGGFTTTAKKNSVRVTRVTDDGKRTRILVAVEDIGEGKAPNFTLRPGDVVFVDERPI